MQEVSGLFSKYDPELSRCSSHLAHVAADTAFLLSLRHFIHRRLTLTVQTNLTMGSTFNKHTLQPDPILGHLLDRKAEK